jgi:hypothetical protein
MRDGTMRRPNEIVSHLNKYRTGTQRNNPWPGAETENERRTSIMKTIKTLQAEFNVNRITVTVLDALAKQMGMLWEPIGYKSKRSKQVVYGVKFPGHHGFAYIGTVKDVAEALEADTE